MTEQTKIKTDVSNLSKLKTLPSKKYKNLNTVAQIFVKKIVK